VLPLRKGENVLVVGKSADSIQNQTGGWSLGWQGTGNLNSDFPAGDSILAGLAEALGENRVTYSVDAKGVDLRAYDAVIAVIGETPYAELVGDIEGHDTLRHSRRYPEDLQVLQAVAGKGVPIITVLLTGRPVWVNDLLNLSDAFVVAWLPGTEGKGVADVVVGTSHGKPRFDFTGRLSFSWPRDECQSPLNAGQANYRPLYALNDGLRYGQTRAWKTLSGSTVPLGCRREAVLPIFNQTNHGAFALHLASVDGSWPSVRVGNDPALEQLLPPEQPRANVKTVQINTQQDAKQVQWLAPAKLVSLADRPVDLRSYAEHGSVVMDVRVEQLPTSPVLLAIECGDACRNAVDVTPWILQLGVQRKGTLSIPLACFAPTGTQWAAITAPWSVLAAPPFSAAFTKIRIEEDTSVKTPLRCNHSTPWQPSKT
jgi:beta-glucosidase